MPDLKRIWMPSPNYRPVRSEKPRLLVLHTTEGAKTIQSLGTYFSRPAVQASSHAGADDTPNTIGVYVRRGNVAWTQGGANDESISLELCAFARWSAEEWDRHPGMLKNAAQWLAEEAAHSGIPLVRLSPAQAQNGERGVCDHDDLGAWGGGHWDCGNNFPMARVLDMAREGIKEQPTEFTWYYLQDVTAARLARGQRMYYGGWDNKEGRDKLAEGLTRGHNHPFRTFRDDDFDAPYFIDNSAYVKEIYGGWRSKTGRDHKQKELEEALGRKLRPFSETRTAAQGGVPWGCRNLVAP